MRLFIRSAEIKHDSRLNKYLKALALNSIEHYVLYWDRSSTGKSEIFNDRTAFHRKSKYGGRYRNLLNILRWNFFIASYIIKNRKRISSIHAVDFDSVMPVYLVTRVIKINYIFDIYDKYSDSRGVTGPLKNVVDFFERHFIRKAKVTILADESRVVQHELSDLRNILIVENVPEKLDLKKYEDLHFPKDKIKLGYVGGLEKAHRGLENITEVVKDMIGVEFYIAGFGVLENYFIDMSDKYENIHFIGACEHSEGMAILSECDLTVGMYYLSVPNHKFAAPNKYYEHLMLGKPLLTTKGSPPGDKVLKNQTGWAIGDEKHDIRDFLESIDMSQVAEYGKNAMGAWEELYSDYFDTVHCSEYLRSTTA